MKLDTWQDESTSWIHVGEQFRWQNWQLIKPMSTTELDLLSVSKLWIEILHLSDVPYDIKIQNMILEEREAKSNPVQESHCSDFKTGFNLSWTFLIFALVNFSVLSHFFSEVFSLNLFSKIFSLSKTSKCNFTFAIQICFGFQSNKIC